MRELYNPLLCGGKTSLVTFLCLQVLPFRGHSEHSLENGKQWRASQDPPQVSLDVTIVLLYN
jgi:hypothetical protein